MSSSLRRVESGWLVRSIEQAKLFERDNPGWVVKVRENWPEKPAPSSNDLVDKKA